MQSIIKKLFATCIAVALLFTLSSCGIMRGNFDLRMSGSASLSASGSAELHRQLKKQGSELRPEYDQTLADKAQKIAEKTAALWEAYGWDGKSAKSAELTAEEKLVVSANLSEDETLLETFSYSENVRFEGYLGKLAKLIIASGKQCTKEGAATVSFKGQVYVFAAIS